MIDEKILKEKRKQIKEEFETEKAKAIILEQAMAKEQKAYGAIIKKMSGLQSQYKLIDELLKK